MDVDVTFDDRGLVPAVLQDAETGQVLMVAWMNQEALRLTQETSQAHFWSRSRQELWHKGATSGNVMYVREMRMDCDGDTLLVLVDPAGPACHTGERSCFYRTLGGFSYSRRDDPRRAPSDQKRDESPAEGERAVEQGRSGPAAPGGALSNLASSADTRSILDELFHVILDRRRSRPPGSYTVELFDAGEDEILKKVGEEAMEVMLAAKGQADARVVSEIADLLYHLFVLLAARGLEPADVEDELTRRRR